MFDHDGPRTNNNAEGFNSKLNIYMGVAKPNMYGAVATLNAIENSTSLAYRRALTNITNGKETKKSRLIVDVAKDVKLQIVKDLLRDEEITVESFFNKVCFAYEF